MKREELQFGDWFSTYVRGERYNQRYTEEYAKLLKLDENVYDSFYPIEVTPANLKENGFLFGFTSNEEDMMSCTEVHLSSKEKGWVYDEGAGSVKIQFQKNCDSGELRIDGDERSISFYFTVLYIHELQNLMRLCGINKEIDLG